MQDERIEKLLERYFEAQTTSAEEAELRHYFTSEPSVPEKWSYAQRLFGGFEALSTEIAAPVHPPIRRGRVIRLVAITAVAAVVCAGVFALVGYLNRPYCYINGVPVRDAEIAMQTTVYFEPLKMLDQPVNQVDEMVKTISKQ